MIGRDVDREKERVVTLYQGSSEKAYRRDYREDELFVTIESLRCELLEVAEQRSLSDHAVLELSERLDGYILLAQHKMMENLRSRKASATAYC
ncbi:Spo0E like sporulation regulatory protein [compost metagenome]|nr:aspartyl-phosphate phosphatase Spo0E family protein [Paenibacillus sp. B2(2019)]